MANVIIPQRFWVRRGTAAALTTADEVLNSGEWCYETDTGRVKIGDGSTAWTSLPYATASQISALSDVDVTGLADGDVLAWDAVTSKWVAGAPAGGLTNPMTTAGDIITGGASGTPQRLAAGTNTWVLTMVAGAPAWATPAPPTASAVTITDAGGYFTGADVEAALQELGAAGGAGGGGGATFRRNYLTIGAQAAATQVGIALAVQGTTLANNGCTSTNVVSSLPRIFYRAAAATNAIGGFYNNNAHSIWRGNSAGLGGFDFKCTWCVGEGVTNTSCRAFCGLHSATGGATDVDPSTLTNIAGMGWDSADTNIQIMHNDGSGTATKVDLGASFPVPVVDSSEAYSIVLQCDPNGSTIAWTVTRLSTNAVATGTISTDMPSNTTFLGPRGYISAGGVSTQTSIGIMYLGWEPGQ